jgi:hypothetical protein
VSGDVLDLVSWTLFGKPTKGLDREGWNRIREWFGSETEIVHDTPFPEPPPNYPPVEKVQELWNQFDYLSQERPEFVVYRWLKERGLDPELVALLDIVRVAPTRPISVLATDPPIRAPRWPGCAALPQVDATGLLRSLLFRAVVPPETGPKSYALAGYERRGLVLADPVGQALLARSGSEVGDVHLPEGGDPIRWNGFVILTEGEPDFLTIAAHPKRVRSNQTYAVLGWLGSGGLPKEIGARIPSSSHVRVCPHADKAGEKAGERTMDVLGHVENVRVVKIGTMMGTSV